MPLLQCPRTRFPLDPRHVHMGLQACCQSPREPVGSVPRRRRGGNSGIFPKRKQAAVIREGKRMLVPKQQMSVSRLVCSDVIFHRRTTEGNTHEAPAGLWGDRIWADLWLPPRRAPRWPGLGSPLLTAQRLVCVSSAGRKEGGKRRAGKESGRDRGKDTSVHLRGAKD